jgi:hypothetical protein
MTWKEFVFYAMMVGGWLMFVYLCVSCFLGARDDGDHTPQGNMARGCAFVFGMILLVFVIMPIVELAQFIFTGSSQ